MAYTLGPALRIPDIKNKGRDLALEELQEYAQALGDPRSTLL